MLIVSSVVLSWWHIASLCFACKSRIAFKQVTSGEAPFLKDAGKQLESHPMWDRRFWQVKLYQCKHAEMKTNTSRLANYGHIGVSRLMIARSSSWPDSSDNLDVRTNLDVVGGLSVIFSNPLFHMQSYKLLDWHQAGISQAMWPELTPNPAPLILLIARAKPTLFIGPSPPCHRKLMRTK